jgi:hypothetical protein
MRRKFESRKILGFFVSDNARRLCEDFGRKLAFGRKFRIAVSCAMCRGAARARLAGIAGHCGKWSALPAQRHFAQLVFVRIVFLIVNILCIRRRCGSIPP